MPIEFKQTQLDNGLTIVAETNPDAHTAAAGFFVKAGSRDERQKLMGVSHFLEHMMFKGTARRSAADVNREFDEIGANYNASTSQETTTYYAHVLPEHLEHAIDLWTDMLRPSLQDDDFDMEKKVILEEIGMYEDRPFWVVYEQAMEDYFQNHTLGHRILGTNHSITDLHRNHMRDYFNERYSPDNIVVSLAGKLDFNQCVDQIAKACGSWERTEVARDYAPPTPHATEQLLTRESVNMHYIIGICPGPSAQSDDRYPAAVLSTILGDSEGSRLYWKLIDPGLADEAELSHQPFDQVGVYMYYASCDPQNAERVEETLDHVFDTAGDDLSSDEVERAVSKMAMSMTLSGEKPLGRMMALGGQWLYLNRYMPLEDELRRVQSVSAGKIEALLTTFNFHPRTVVRMTPRVMS